MSDNTPQEQPRKEISAEEFIKIWKGEYRGVEGYEEFYEEKYGEEVVVFDSYKVVGNIEINEEKELPNIELRNTETGYFSIRDNSTTGDFWIDNSTTGSFEIDNSTTGYFWIRDNSTTGYFWILNNSTTGDFEISNSTTGDFWIGGSSSTGNFSIYDNSVVESIAVNKASIENITIENGVYVNKLSLTYLTAKCKALTIKDSTIDNLKLNLDNPYQITIKKEIIGSIINNLNFRETIFPKDAYLHISDTDVNQMNIDSFLNQGTIVFNNIFSIEDTNGIEKDEYGNAIRYEEGAQKGKYQFEQINEPSKLSLINSDLGNTQFIGCDLAGFKTFEFKNSKMAGVFLADTTLPHRSKITTPKGANENEQRRLALSQFKKIYEGQGDMVRAAEYRAEEMEVYKEYISTQKGLPTRKERWNRRAELWNLKLNKFSSYYGNNWLRAAVVTLIFNSVLFTLYCWAQGFWLGTDYEQFFTLAAYSLEFLNPLRKADFLEKVTGHHPEPLAIFIDYISRIIIAYFAYQTVAAFRKFGRKSA